MDECVGHEGLCANAFGIVQNTFDATFWLEECFLLEQFDGLIKEHLETCLLSVSNILQGGF